MGVFSVTRYAQKHETKVPPGARCGCEQIDSVRAVIRSEHPQYDAQATLDRGELRRRENSERTIADAASIERSRLIDDDLAIVR